jgi:hypothetical protein
MPYSRFHQTPLFKQNGLFFEAKELAHLNYWHFIIFTRDNNK